MNRVYKFKHPAGTKHQGVGPELEENVAMTDLDTKHVEESHQEEPVVIHIHGIDAVVAELGIVAERLKFLLDDLYKSRVFKDDYPMISANVGYEVDYKDHKFLFLLCKSAQTLVITSGGTLPVVANVWLNICFTRGEKLYLQGVSDSAPVMVQIRAMDDRMV